MGKQQHLIASPVPSGAAYLLQKKHTRMHLSLQDIRQREILHPLCAPMCHRAGEQTLGPLHLGGTCSKGEAGTESISACFYEVTSQTWTECSVTPYQFRTIPAAQAYRHRTEKAEVYGIQS